MMNTGPKAVEGPANAASLDQQFIFPPGFPVSASDLPALLTDHSLNFLECFLFLVLPGGRVLHLPQLGNNVVPVELAGRRVTCDAPDLPGDGDGYSPLLKMLVEFLVGEFTQEWAESAEQSASGNGFSPPGW